MDIEKLKEILSKTADLWTDEERKVLETANKTIGRERLKSIRREVLSKDE